MRPIRWGGGSPLATRASSSSRRDTGHRKGPTRPAQGPVTAAWWARSASAMGRDAGGNRPASSNSLSTAVASSEGTVEPPKAGSYLSGPCGGSIGMAVVTLLERQHECLTEGGRADALLPTGGRGPRHAPHAGPRDRRPAEGRGADGHRGLLGRLVAALPPQPADRDHRRRAGARAGRRRGRSVGQ